MKIFFSDITDESFEQQVLNASMPVLVEFLAEWCGPCRMLQPILEEVSKEITRIKYLKMDVDQNPSTPTHYGVRSIPTLILFDKGKALSRKVGLLLKTKLTEWINSSI